MDIIQIGEKIRYFLEWNRRFFGDVIFDVKKPIDAARFCDEYEKILEGKVNGLYIFVSKKTFIPLYVGKSNNIPKRFGQHIGKNYTWTKDGSKASFPNIFIEQHWIPPEPRNILSNAEFYVIVVWIDRFDEIATILEYWLIYILKPLVNVEGKG